MNKNKSHYINSINKAIDFIDRNLSKPITLGEVANTANFSKYHFNRIFSSVVGETPYQFILRLRLEKAATFIQTNYNESITDIAYQCGFSDISIFSRSFKKHFSVSAKAFRAAHFKNSNNHQVKRNNVQRIEAGTLHICPDFQTLKWSTNMNLNKNVEVKNLPVMTLAYIRNMGPWDGDRAQYEVIRNKLFAWAEEKDVLFQPNFKYLILYRDNPKVALSDKLRMSQCIIIPSETEVDGEIGKMELDAAKYVIARFEMKPQDFPKAWEWLYGQWLPNSGYIPDDKPYFETYPEPPSGEVFKVDFCVPVKRS